ncbi:MAG: hypothetical protein ACK5MN_02860 [Lachnospiraceae bacterium]
MDNDKVYTTSLRLYKKRPAHAQAYRCLKNYNTDIFKTKDDYIAEAILYFSRYLKQEGEAKQLQVINDYLRQQNDHLVELVKTAICQVQNDKMADIIKEAVTEAISKNEIRMKSKEDKISDDTTIQKSGNWERDMQFAQFYDMED